MSYKIFKALSDPTRMKIVEVIGNREICACEIPKKVGKSQPNVSQQLKMLEDVGILKSRRDGKMILYSVKNEKVFKLIKITDEIEAKK
jgi:DNA-binding transcriptional ArsR family regulator